MALCCPSKSKITLCLSLVFKILMRPDGSGEPMGDLREQGFACTVKERKAGTITNLCIA